MKTRNLSLIVGLFIWLISRSESVGQPVITRNPTNVSVSLGASIVFTVTPSGTAPFAYLWTYNDKTLDWATNRSLTLTNIQLVNAGRYAAIVSNAAGSVTSKVAILDVDPTFTKITTGPVVSDTADGENAAWADFDNDGDPDLFVGAGSTSVDLLYRNDGNGEFTRITTGAIPTSGGNASAAAWVDLDNDGRLDLFVGKFSGKSLLFRQQPDGSFTKTNLSVAGAAWEAAWTDYDRDGFVDLLVADTSHNIMWHNDGSGNLVAVTNNVIDTHNAYSMSFVDYDNDGDQDLLVSNLIGKARLYRNDGNGIFTPITTGVIATNSASSSGAAWGDYDNDGYPDLLLATLPGDGVTRSPRFFHNNRDGTFSMPDQAPFNEAVGDWTDAACGDYDNDGWLDIFVAEFMGRGSRLYHNNGDGTFTRVQTGSLVNDRGSSGSPVWGDYDRDGFLDLFVSNGTNGGGEISDYLYHNNGNSNGWIVIKCIGTVSNRSALGTKLRLKATIGGKTFWQLREISSGPIGSYLEAHFGLGNATNIETLRIEWPSGTVQEFANLAPKQFLTLKEPAKLQMASAGMLEVRSWNGQVFTIESSSDLKRWTTAAAVTNLNGTLKFSNPDGAAGERLFYRARQD
jgi:hypothetical protein